MKNLLIAAAAAAVAASLAFGFQQFSLDPGANIVANRIEGKWMLDKEMTRRLDPDASTSTMIALEFTTDKAVLKRLQNHNTAGDLFRNRRIFGAGLMKVGREKSYPYVLATRDGDMKLTWFEPTDPHTDPLNPAGLVDSKAVMLACSRSGEHDMLFLGGDHVREASACYGRLAFE